MALTCSVHRTAFCQMTKKRSSKLNANPMNALSWSCVIDWRSCENCCLKSCTSLTICKRWNDLREYSTGRVWAYLVKRTRWPPTVGQVFISNWPPVVRVVCVATSDERPKLKNQYDSLPVFVSHFHFCWYVFCWYFNRKSLLFKQSTEMPNTGCDSAWRHIYFNHNERASYPCQILPTHFSHYAHCRLLLNDFAEFDLKNKKLLNQKTNRFLKRYC